jgi:hypothetical protein
MDLRVRRHRALEHALDIEAIRDRIHARPLQPEAGLETLGCDEATNEYGVRPRGVLERYRLDAAASTRLGRRGDEQPSCECDDADPAEHTRK